MTDEPIPADAPDIPLEPAAAPEEVGAEAQPESALTGPRLILKRAGVETDIVFPFTCPATVGRFDPDKGPIDIDLADLPEGGYVSRRHAKINFEDSVYVLTDLDSSNGSFVLRKAVENGDFERVQSSEISDGDEIAFGNARFLFREGA